MANLEHVECLKRSIREWNQWREHHLEIQPDLSGAVLDRENLRGADLHGAYLDRANLNGTALDRADLSEANLLDAHLIRSSLNRTNLMGTILDRADLREANLFGAFLTGAYLREADLGEANLRKAKLNRANLCKANLSGVDFRGANLSGVNLIGADLQEANLSGANLSQAIMTDCIMSGTFLAFTDLSTVCGLDTIRHQNTSMLDLNTIVFPYGSIRTTFMSGVGCPETMIEYYDAIFTQPIQFYSCFISYTQADEEVARKLYTDLRNAGVRCFFAPHDLKPGDYYHKRIDNAIQVHDKLLLLLSEQSVQSFWVEHEVMSALGREKRERREILFPLRLDDTVMETQTDWAKTLRDARHIGDMAGWQQQDTYQAAFQEVVRHLKVGLMPLSK